MTGESKQQLTVLERLWKWVAENPIKVATSLGGVSYVLLWVGYHFYYAEFEVSVQEVGLGYVEILTQAVAYFVVMLVLVFALLCSVLGVLFLLGFFLYGIASLLATLLDVLAKSQLKLKLDSIRWPRDTSVSKHGWISILSGLLLALSIVLTLVLILIIGVLDARHSAKAVMSGEPLRAHAVGNIIPSPYIFRGEKVDVKWIGQTSPMKVGGSLMYLGTAESTSVFYDYKEKKTLRIPSSAILIIGHRLKEDSPNPSNKMKDQVLRGGSQPVESSTEE
jgi:hypothetical protein